jgi:hypothetical protein
VTATTTAPAITRPGVYPDLDEQAYHAHPALSYSLGKAYLRSPAHYLYALHNRTERAEFDFGHAVHAKVLGIGMDIAVIPADILASNGATSTKAAKEFLEEARAAGKVPLKAEVVARVDAAAEAVLGNATARRYLELDGAPEVSLFATDPETGVPMRGRIDYLPHRSDGRRTFPIDLKSTTNASTDKIRRHVGDYHYDVQAAMYRRLIELARGDATGPMIQIYVEVDPPHGVNVVQLAHEEWVKGGNAKLDHILRRHAECVAANHWPAYPAGTHPIEPLPWYLDQAYSYEDADS